MIKTVGELKRFIEDNNLPDDMPILGSALTELMVYICDFDDVDDPNEEKRPPSLIFDDN